MEKKQVDITNSIINFTTGMFKSAKKHYKDVKNEKDENTTRFQSVKEFSFRMFDSGKDNLYDFLDDAYVYNYQELERKKDFINKISSEYTNYSNDELKIKFNEIKEKKREKSDYELTLEEKILLKTIRERKNR